MEKTTMPAKKVSGRFYPGIDVPHIKDPNKFYAFPVLGFVVKLLMLIPVGIELFFVAIAVFFITILINPFVVLFTGKYWDTAYELTSGFMRLQVKVAYFLFGLTNKYPGFSFSIDDAFAVDIPKPQNPNRLFAIPVLGGLFRIIVLIPYMIYENVIRQAASIGATASSFVVLTKGTYPESTYQLERDSVRVGIGAHMYMVGFSDTYPSFWISMDHQTVKIILIILGVMTSGFNMNTNVDNMMRETDRDTQMQQYDEQDWERMLRQQDLMEENPNYTPATQ